MAGKTSKVDAYPTIIRAIIESSLISWIGLLGYNIPYIMPAQFNVTVSFPLLFIFAWCSGLTSLFRQWCELRLIFPCSVNLPYFFQASVCSDTIYALLPLIFVSINQCSKLSLGH
jgi:hypothetical protein